MKGTANGEAKRQWGKTEGKRTQSGGREKLRHVGGKRHRQVVRKGGEVAPNPVFISAKGKKKRIKVKQEKRKVQ